MNGEEPHNIFCLGSNVLVVGLSDGGSWEIRRGTVFPFPHPPSSPPKKELWLKTSPSTNELVSDWKRDSADIDLTELLKSKKHEDSRARLDGVDPLITGPPKKGPPLNLILTFYLGK